MPFIRASRRYVIDKGGLGLDGLGVIEPGDRCYVFYKEMVDKWKASPRWTTAHYIYLHLDLQSPINEDDWVAQKLAWQVFFQLYVMPYELKKREENGDI